MLQKEVDRSVLSEGMSIPVSFQNLFYERLGFRLAHGESKRIKVMIGQNTYDALLINQPFDTEKYPDHGDVLQIRYSPSGGLAKELRSIFTETASIVNEYLEKRIDKKKRLVISAEKKEYVAIYATPVAGVLLFDCITCGEYQEEASVIKRMDEKILENTIDENAGKTILELR